MKRGAVATPLLWRLLHHRRLDAADERASEAAQGETDATDVAADASGVEADLFAGIASHGLSQNGLR